jgi:ABC-type amino acid transport system permease subunit
MAAFVMVYVLKPKDVLMFGVSAIGVFLSAWVVEAIRSALSSD